MGIVVGGRTFVFFFFPKKTNKKTFLVISCFLSGSDITDPHLLQCIFSAIQLPWLCVGISQQLLNNMDDYLLAEEQVKDLSRISLSHIVSTFVTLNEDAMPTSNCQPIR